MTIAQPDELPEVDGLIAADQNFKTSSSMQSASIASICALSYLPTNLQNMSEGLWASFDGLSEPAPNFHLKFDHDELLSSSTPTKVKMALKIPRSSKEKELSNSSGWEHVVVAKGGLPSLSAGNGEDEARRQNDRRPGRLDPQTKERARRIRRVGACWSCWIQKVPVSLSC
jgi:hypothetical protein